jgi:glycine cleavage system aminomethyltransferase T
MKARVGAAVAALATAVALAAPAQAAAPSLVTINSEGGGFYGKVKSEKKKCKSDRKVIVFKLKGKAADPKNDEKVGSDLSDSRGNWSTGNSGQYKGRFYAKAKKSPGCRAATSETIRAQK